MKKSNLVKSIAALSLITMIGGGIIAAQAASNNANTSTNNLFNGRGNGKNIENRVKLTDEQIADRQTKMDAVRTALTNNDYSAWVAAVTALNANSPLLEKITLSNFTSFVKAHELREEANTIMKELGIENEGIGMGMGGQGKGNRGGMGMMGLGGGCNQTANLEK